MRNLTMLTDMYQFTMIYGYFQHNMTEHEAVFDLFYRRSRDNTNGYSMVAGLDQMIEYIENLHFDADDIQYLRSLSLFNEPFLEYLSGMRFHGDIFAMPEGTVAYPREPLVRVRAPILEAQLIETALLNIINHQTLIATKASRVVHATDGASVLEFGLRRAQGPDAGIYGARAAVIGGCSATSNVMTGAMFGIPISGTHAHSWVMSFPDELTAFRAYAETFPSKCLLLVDTYDTLKSGVPNAIQVFRELREKGFEPTGIRLDSGDLAYLSKKARKMMDDAGFPNAKICASNDLDEHLIWELRAQGAMIDIWGVGTKLITSDDQPSLGGVYKMSAEIINGEIIPKIKISENPEKITTPGLKQVYRLYENSTGKAIADLITLDHERIDTGKPLRIFDPADTWKTMTLTDFSAKPLLQPIFVQGKRVYDSPKLMDIQAYGKQELASFWPEYTRLHAPHHFKVDLSDELYALRQRMLERH